MEDKVNITRRLRRIEGQIKGIGKMVEDDKHCKDILMQIAAVRAAINKVGSLILEEYSVASLESAASSKEKEEAIIELERAMETFMKSKH